MGYSEAHSATHSEAQKGIPWTEYVEMQNELWLWHSEKNPNHSIGFSVKDTLDGSEAKS